MPLLQLAQPYEQGSEFVPAREGMSATGKDKVIAVMTFTGLE